MRITSHARTFGIALVIVGALTRLVSAAEPTVVNIDNFTFAPQTITVSKGSTVQWVNRDDTPHRIVSNENKFKSPVVDTDDKFSWTFSEAGTFKYFCSLHPHMTGTIVVGAK